MAGGSQTKLVLGLLGAMALAGCEEGALPAFLQGGGDAADDAGTVAPPTVRTVERDVEAPEVFQVTDKGLWDGRPSLGGVWVAHPNVTDPERVIIRNEDNGKFVVGVIYRPERQTPGPKFQVSSDAAAALEMLAGQPATLNVTALRRQEVPVEEPAQDAPTEGLSEAPAVATTSLDPIEAAAAALDEAEGKTTAAAPVRRPTPPAVAEPEPEPEPEPSTSGLAKPYIQIGIFSVKENADNTAEALRQAGMVPTIKPGKMNGKDFWRIILGPITTTADRAALLKKLKELGFTDSYSVTN